MHSRNVVCCRIRLGHTGTISAVVTFLWAAASSAWVAAPFVQSTTSSARDFAAPAWVAAGVMGSVAGVRWDAQELYGMLQPL